MLDALDALALAGPHLHAHELGSQALEEDLVDEGGFAAAGNAGDHGEGPQGEVYGDVVQVVFRRADDAEMIAVSFAALLGQGDLPPAGEVLAREGVFVFHHFFRRAAGHHLTAVNTGAGADVDEIVGGPHGVLVVLYHQQGVAQVPQLPQRRKQFIVIPLVQADGGLVQDIENAHEAGTDLGGQADALALAAGEGPGGAGEGQIPQAHGLQKVQPGPNFL